MEPTAPAGPRRTQILEAGYSLAVDLWTRCSRSTACYFILFFFDLWLLTANPSPVASGGRAAPTFKAISANHSWE